MAKVENINGTSFGGFQFDGARSTDAEEILSSSFTLADEGTKTFSLTSILPNDGYDYYCTFTGWCQTGTTSGNAADLQFYGGSSRTASDAVYSRCCRVATRHASAQANGGTVAIPIYASDRHVTVYNGDGNGTGTYYLSLTSYRRMGDSDNLQNAVEKITTEDGTYDIGGKFVNGNVINIKRTTSLGSIASKATSNVDLSSVIPNDGYEYEALVCVTTGSEATTNKYIQIWVQGPHEVARYYTRSATSYTSGGNAWIRLPSNSRQVSVYNGGSIATANTSFKLSYARRVGYKESNCISYFRIPSDTKQPNIIVHGSPTISNGVVSGFFDYKNFAEIPAPSVLGSNFEVQVKFRTPSTWTSPAQWQNTLMVTPTNRMAMGIDTTNHKADWNIGTGSAWLASRSSTGDSYGVTTLSLNTDYYAKFTYDGYSYKGYLSQDGETWTLDWSLDSPVQVSLPYKMIRIGVGSAGNYSFLGSIDLNGCYIKVNDDYIWRGMDYSTLHPIGGPSFDGNWIKKTTGGDNFSPSAGSLDRRAHV